MALAAPAGRRPGDDGRRPPDGQGGGRPPGLARRQARRLRRLGDRPGAGKSNSRPLPRAAGRGRAEAADDLAGRRQPPALEPRRQVDRVPVDPGRVEPGLAAAGRRRRGPAGHEAPGRRGRPDLVADGGTIAFAAEVFPGKTPEETAAMDEKKATEKSKVQVYDKLMVRHWDRWDDGKRSHLFVVDAGDRQGQRPDPEARGQRPPRPVRRLVRLRLRPRRQGAGLHRRAGQGHGLVDQHRRLDRFHARRRAAEPHRRQPRGRRPADLLAPTAIPGLRQPGPRRASRPTAGSSKSATARRRGHRPDRPKLDRPVQSFAWAGLDAHDADGRDRPRRLRRARRRGIDDDPGWDARRRRRPRLRPERRGSSAG